MVEPGKEEEGGGEEERGVLMETYFLFNRLVFSAAEDIE